MLTCLLLPPILPTVYSQYNSQRNILFKYKKLKDRTSCAQNPPLTQNGSLSLWTNTDIKNPATGTLWLPLLFFSLVSSLWPPITASLLLQHTPNFSNLYISWFLCLKCSSSRYQHGWLSYFKSSHKCHLLSEDHHDFKIATSTHHPPFLPYHIT